jgi:hypothetical protein
VEAVTIRSTTDLCVKFHGQIVVFLFRQLNGILNDDVHGLAPGDIDNVLQFFRWLQLSLKAKAVCFAPRATSC